MKQAFGVDIGGTKIDIASVNEEGKILNRKKIPTHVSGGPDVIIQEIAAVIRELQAQSESQATSIGIGMAGQILGGSGVVKFAPNLKWENVPLQSSLSDRLDLPVFVTNDVRAAAWGEWMHGAGKKCENLVCVFVGTGIGGGIVVNGQMMAGSRNSAGELGHTVIQMNGPTCTCGNKGCLEALAGGWAVAKQARELAKNHPDKAKFLLSQVTKIEEITPQHVIQAAKNGDPTAQNLLDQTIEAITIGCSNFLNAFNPERLIIGGGLGLALPNLIPSVTEGVKKKALKTATEDVKILPASLHNDAGVIGAAAWSLHIY